VANSEKMASRVYREGRNVWPPMFEKVLSNENSAFLGDEERKDVLQGQYSLNLLGLLLVRGAHMYVAPSDFSVKSDYQHLIEQLDNQVTRSMNTMPPAEE
jgi:hypothetical protein